MIESRKVPFAARSTEIRGEKSSLQKPLSLRRRFSVPEDMLTFAGIRKNVVTVGCGNYVEIWAAERWEENKLDEEPENFAAVLESLGL